MSAWCQDWTDTALVTGILIIALLAGATSRALAGRAGLARRIALICLDAILAAGALTLMWTLAARHTPIETVVTQMQAVAAGGADAAMGMTLTTGVTRDSSLKRFQPGTAGERKSLYREIRGTLRPLTRGS